MAILDNPATRIGTAIAISLIFFAIVLSFLKPIPLPIEIETALNWLFETLWEFDFMIPVSTIISIFSLIILVDIIFMMFKLVMFIKKHITQKH